MIEKEYIGDGVYVDYTGFEVVLTTEEGPVMTNCIYLEPHVWRALVRYMARVGYRDTLEQKESS